MNATTSNLLYVAMGANVFVFRDWYVWLEIELRQRFFSWWHRWERPDHVEKRYHAAAGLVLAAIGLIPFLLGTELRPKIEGLLAIAANLALRALVPFRWQRALLSLLSPALLIGCLLALGSPLEIAWLVAVLEAVSWWLVKGPAEG